jgi:hypothetical protein
MKTRSRKDYLGLYVDRNCDAIRYEPIIKHLGLYDECEIQHNAIKKAVRQLEYEEWQIRLVYELTHALVMMSYKRNFRHRITILGLGVIKYHRSEVLEKIKAQYESIKGIEYTRLIKKIKKLIKCQKH